VRSSTWLGAAAGLLLPLVALPLGWVFLLPWGSGAAFRAEELEEQSEHKADL